MAIQRVDVAVIGGGQAGIAMSEHLSKCGIPHLVFERHRIAERWRTGRWDSLVANGPAWHDRFPPQEFSGIDQDAFVPKEQVADYFVDYAEQIGAPVRCGVEVTLVERLPGQAGFRVETSDGSYDAKAIVAATGPFQKPVFPPLVPDDTPVTQMHSLDYKNPNQVSEGAVLVVGAGSSGVQIADELLRAGRDVFLSIGPHDRLPRRYRNRDYVWWMGVLGMWDDERIPPGKEHISISVSGAYGGRTIDFRDLARNGMTLVGRTEGFSDGSVHFAGDLSRNIAAGDEYYISFLDQCDAYLAANGLDLPEEPAARELLDDPECVASPIDRLDLAGANVSTVIWATGYRPDFSWLQLDVFDEGGRPRHVRGVAPEPGLYFLGLPWLTRRGSSFIYGVWHDAKHIADHIFIQRKYGDYEGTAKIVLNDD
ncbi:MAG: NAD(P)/FAD-dependent oxidoreductase [Boseongicola sp.]|nr:NAD(P)/FAD-dependent oxidoreductase [Boseongicola sp.]